MTTRQVNALVVTSTIDIPAQWCSRLAAEGIRTLADWRALTPTQQRSIFGVTGAMRRRLDELAQRATK